jgi:hypothetical protein
MAAGSGYALIGAPVSCAGPVNGTVAFPAQGQHIRQFVAYAAWPVSPMPSRT